VFGENWVFSHVSMFLGVDMEGVWRYCGMPQWRL
jgi:hypothetical protein